MSKKYVYSKSLFFLLFSQFYFSYIFSLKFVSEMFKLDPYYNFEEKGVDLPKCMFKVDKVIGNMAVLLPGQNGSDVSAIIACCRKLGIPCSV